MPRTFRSITQSNNAQSAERENRAQMQNWKTNSVLGRRNKRMERYLPLS